ncbi:MAG: iron-containing alcohol dehydrogenase [Lachnospiraceae bacterium]|nr:iron-containing alcohol dehydrogenase [Lachnospiraceae bacterium]
MNILKKIYCRAFQLGFKVAIPILPYREPQILDGMEKIPKVLLGQNKDKVLIVTDAGISKIGLGDKLKLILDDAGIKYEYFDETVANPTIANVEKARKLYISSGCKALIALGGGSSMDCAKAVGARIAKPKQSIQKMRGILKVRKRIPLLIAIPTTAGTGSETTVAAVITDEKTRYKCPVNDFSLIPRYAVLDPTIAFSLPKSLTATTGMDALTHAVEAYIGRSTTKNTRSKAEMAVKLIKENLKVAYDDGYNEKARGNMLKAAYYAGIAFTVSYVGYVHGVAHSLGGQYGTPHGLANAVILPYVLEDYGSACHKKLARLARIADIADSSDDDAKAADKFIAWVKEMNASMNIPTKLMGICDEDIAKMAKHADKESNPLYPVPVLMDAKELEKFYRMVM